MHVKKGDTVLVLAGKDKGKQGKILESKPKVARVVVEKVNLVKRHLKARPGVWEGGIQTKEAPIHVSNVMLICPSCKKPTRVAKTFLEDGTKVRSCKRCGAAIS